MAKKNNRGTVTWAQAVRDIINVAINRGQLIPLGIIVIVLLIIWKMPEDQILVFCREILAMLKKGELISYVLCPSLAMGWFFHAKSMRKHFSNEYLRIGREKSNLQGQAAGEKFESSD